MSKTSVRLVDPSSARDHDALCALIKAHASENGELHLHDASYASRHVLDKFASGPCFFAEKEAVVVGVVTASYVDLAYRQADALEITHTFVLPEHRKYPVVAKLFDAVEAFADAHRLPVCFHELNWLAGIRDEPSQGERVEKLYQFRKYEGPIVSSQMRYPAADGKPPVFRHVGRAYLYRGSPRRDCPLPPLAGVRYPLRGTNGSS